MNLMYKYNTTPFKHQSDAFSFVLDKWEGFALFMEQGTGKTKTTIDIVENLFLEEMVDRVVVIAPNGVHRQWAESELELHGFVTHDTFIWESKKANIDKLTAYSNSKYDERTLQYLFINVDAFSVQTYLDVFRKFAIDGRTFVVIDEATSIKNASSARTSNIMAVYFHTKYAGRRVLSRTPLTVGRCILTGTPTTKGVEGLWSMFEFIQPNFFGRTLYSFKARYELARVAVFNNVSVKVLLKPEDIKRVRGHLDKGFDTATVAGMEGMQEADVVYIAANPALSSPFKHLVELKDKIAERAFIVKKEDCLDLPPKTYIERKVPMNKAQAKVYRDTAKSAWSMYESGTLDATNQLTLRVRLHQIAGGFFPSVYEMDEDGFEIKREETQNVAIETPVKAKAVVDILEEQASFPVIISCAYKAEATYLNDFLSKKGYRCGMIIGEVGQSARQEVVKDLNNEDLDCLIATERTIAKGFNFQAADTMILYSCTFSSEDRMQLEDRIHRIGQKANKVTYIDLVCEGTIDTQVLKVLRGDKLFQQYMQSKEATDFMKFIGEMNE